MDMTRQQQFRLIIKRQRDFQWGDQYVPSTLAIPREAPKRSRTSRLNSRKLNRAIHVMSNPERVFTHLALYCPFLLDIHEQKMLWPYDACHPLSGHPLMKGMFPPPVRGTMEIAKEIGFKHFEITVLDKGSRQRMPFPYQGDLLVYLLGPDGVPFAVNWTIKDRGAAFGERRLSSLKTPSQQGRDRDYAERRTELEAIYYASAGIRTVKASLEIIDATVQANLALLFPMHGLSLTHPEELLADFSAELREAVGSGVAPFVTISKYGKRWGAPGQFTARLYQDIWERRLQVNFFKPILIDHPLDTQGGDPLQVYGSLFQEQVS